MKLATAFDATDAHKEFLRFFKNTSQTIWEKKIAKIESLPLFPYPSPNFYRNYLANRNPLTNSIAAFLKLQREGKLLRKHATDELMRTCGYLRVCNALFHASPELSQKIKATLIDDETVRSFLFELDIAIHFLRLGLDVRFVDLENMQRFDLLVSDGQFELEVECKTKSADAGRKITWTNFNLLCDILAAEWSPTESVAVLLKCDGRLTGSQDLFHELANDIKRSRVSQENRGKVDELSFEIRTFRWGQR